MEKAQHKLDFFDSLIIEYTFMAFDLIVTFKAVK